MKRFLLFLLASAIGIAGVAVVITSGLAPAPQAEAAQFKSGQTVTIPSNQTINDDVYVSSSNITIDGAVNGDVFVGGGTVVLNGPVNGGVSAAGGTVTINSTVSHSVRLAGGQLYVRGKIAKDLVAFGGNITVDSSATIGGLTKIAGGQVTIAGKTTSVEAQTGNITVADTAVINGNLSYPSNAQASIDSGATITGKTIKTASTTQGKTHNQTNPAGLALFSALFWLIFSYLALWLLPHFARGVSEQFTTRSGQSILWGLLLLIGLPAAVLFFLFTLVGIPISIGLFMLYVVLLFFGRIAATLGLGVWLENLWKHTNVTQPTYASTLLGVLLITLIGLIPFVGGLIIVILVLIGMGAAAYYIWTVLTGLRQSKKI